MTREVAPARMTPNSVHRATPTHTEEVLASGLTTSAGPLLGWTMPHPASVQRVRWFKRGFEAGEVKACDTFAADRL